MVIVDKCVTTLKAHMNALVSVDMKLVLTRKLALVSKCEA